MKRALLFAILSTMTLSAQLPFGLGLKGGAVRAENAAPPLTVGPYAEIKIPFLVSVETGLLFKRYAYPGVNRNALEVPILVKKRVGPFPVQPFLSAGATLRKQSAEDWRRGLTLGAGVAFRALLIKVEPEFRFTRHAGGVLPVGRNQVELLFGFRF